LVVLVVGGVGCGEDELVEPAPSAVATTVDATATVAATETPVPIVTITPSATGYYEGVTMRFDYPANWHFWKGSYYLEQESVVIASTPRGEGGADVLPVGVTKIDFYSAPEGFISRYEPPTIGEPRRIDNMEFYLAIGEGADVFWVLSGQRVVNGRDYRVTAYFTMAGKPDTGQVEEIIQSWMPIAP